MTSLRQRMLEDMQIRNLAVNTQESVRYENLQTLAKCWPARLQFIEPTRVHRQIGLGPVPQLL